jgi:hypothetical protein
MGCSFPFFKGRSVLIGGGRWRIFSSALKIAHCVTGIEEISFGINLAVIKDPSVGSHVD